MMSTPGGFYVMHREWMDNPALSGRQSYCRRAAWRCLIETAAWAPHREATGTRFIDLQRGQLTASTHHWKLAFIWAEDTVVRGWKM